VQRRFLNAALSLDTALDPIALLEALLEIERALGRVRRERWGPRTLDLDLLWSGSRVLTRPELTIPHPRLRERTFALRPLLDVEPGAADPETGTPYAELLSRLDQPRLELRAGPDGWALGP
jgi:2-amino-4-hydroxy-6-hydroxymethyldihydropteridine diphosphokinase